MLTPTEVARSPHKQRLASIQKKVDGILEPICLEDLGFERPKQQRRSASKFELKNLGLHESSILIDEIRSLLPIPRMW